MSKIDDFNKEAATSLADLKVRRSKEKYEEFRGRRGQEFELWKKWDVGGRKQEDLHPLLQSLDPLIKSETKKRLQGLGGSIPESALKNTLRTHAVRALETYDPARKTQLTTHVITNFQRVTDFIGANRNPMYMSKEKTETYQQFDNAKKELVDLTGREPTALELQQKLPGHKIKTIREMMKGFAPEAYTEMGTELDSSREQPNVRDAYLLMKSKMTPQERQFAELGPAAPNGIKPMEVKAIAMQLKLPLHRVYHIKSRVQRILGPVLKKE